MSSTTITTLIEQPAVRVNFNVETGSVFICDVTEFERDSLALVEIPEYLWPVVARAVRDARRERTRAQKRNPQGEEGTP